MRLIRILARDDRARALGISLSSGWDPEIEEITLEIKHQPREISGRIDVSAIYSSRAGYDRLFHLKPTADGRYRLPFGVAKPGRWNLHITAEDWRLRDSLVIGAPRSAPALGH